MNGGGGGGGGCPLQLFYITSTTFLTLIWLPAHLIPPLLFYFYSLQTVVLTPLSSGFLPFTHTSSSLSDHQPSISCKIQNPFKCKREKKNTFLAKPTTHKPRTCLNSLSLTLFSIQQKQICRFLLSLFLTLPSLLYKAKKS